MRKSSVVSVLILGSVFVLSGCVVRTYEVTRDRVDQDLAGNRGYIMGQPPKDWKPKKERRRARRMLWKSN